MEIKIPSVLQIRERLSAMNHAELQALADASEVPFPTLMKIRQGTTSNPGIETVRKFMPILVLPQLPRQGNANTVTHLADGLSLQDRRQDQQPFEGPDRRLSGAATGKAA